MVELSDADNHTKQHAMTARLLLRSWIVILEMSNNIYIRGNTRGNILAVMLVIIRVSNKCIIQFLNITTQI